MCVCVCVRVFLPLSKLAYECVRVRMSSRCWMLSVNQTQLKEFSWDSAVTHNDSF